MENSVSFALTVTMTFLCWDLVALTDSREKTRCRTGTANSRFIRVKERARYSSSVGKIFR
jgi:hypothetical protein